MNHHPLRDCSAFVALAAGVLAILGVAPAGYCQEPVADTKTVRIPIDETPIVEAAISESDRLHWSFSPVARSPLPAVKRTNWLRTPVDAFIFAAQEKQQVGPAPEAGRSVLQRRLAFDLTGLPPTPDQLVEFEHDSAPDAYERLADRLLATPAFGERWAQHWLDLARFAETDGFEHDKVRPDAWQYRDWVIEAINVDLPFDEFVRQQLAGDQESAANAIPTMFCLAGPDMPDINDQAERRHNRLNELTAAVGSVFLGLQLGCAQCHDHKYDPLSQADFYRLRAVFEPAVPPLKRDVPYTALAEQKNVEPARFWVRGDHRRPGPELPAGFPRIASTAEFSLQPQAGVNPREKLADWLTRDDNPLTSRVIANRLWQHHFGRGIVETPSDFGLLGAAPTHPELLDWLAAELRLDGWGEKRLHRTIVCSATYRQISYMRFQNSDSGQETAKGLEPEAEKRQAVALYTHFPRRRLDGEAIRDSLLTVAGLLTTERGGPGVMPPLPEELVGTLLKGQWKASEREAEHYRRSVYVFARRNLRYPLFEAFDRPDGNASCAARSRSTTAPQSLVLLNSELSLLAARHLAGRLIGHSPDPAEQVDALDRIALGGSLIPAEKRQLLEFLAAQRQRLRAAAGNEGVATQGLPVTSQELPDQYAAAALVDLCLAVLNSSQFLYVD